MHRRIYLLARLCLLTALLVLACGGNRYERPAYATGPQVRTVRLSPGAEQPTLDTATGHLFIADPNRHLVEMRSAATGDLLRTIPAGESSIVLLLAARQRHLFITAVSAADGAGTVLVVDSRTGQVLRVVAVGRFPQPILLDDGAARLLISTKANQTPVERQATSAAIVILDAHTGRVTARIPYPGTVQLGAFDPQRHRAIVVYDNGTGERAGQSYGAIDTRAGRLLPIADSNQNGNQPMLDMQRGIAMIIDTDESTVHVINTATGVVLHTIKVDAFPWNGSIDPRSGRAYIVSQGRAVDGVAINSTFSALDLQAGTVLHQTRIGENATGISLNPAGDRAYVALRTGDLAVLDTGSGRLLRTVRVGETSDYLPAFVSHGLAYAMSFGDVLPQGSAIDASTSGMLRVLSAHDGAPLRTIAIGVNPSWPPLADPTGQWLFFSSPGPPGGMNAFPTGPGSVSIVDAATGRLLRKIPVGIGPSLIDLDPARGHLLVLNRQGDGTAPPSPGRGIPVCSAKIRWFGPNPPPCRQASASLSIITLAH